MGCTTCSSHFKSSNLSHAVTIKVYHFGVPAPAANLIVAAVVRELFYFATVEGHYENIRIAVLSPGKSYKFSVGRYPRACFISLHGSKAGSQPVIHRSFP